MNDRSDSDRRPPTLVRAAVATYGTNLAAVSFSLLNVLIVARVLGPTGRGEIAFIIVLSGLVTWLSSMGIEEANANLGGTRPEVRASLATNSVIAAFLFGFAGAGVVVVLVLLFPAIGGEVDQGLLFITLATLPVGLLLMYMKYLLQSDYRFGVTNLAWVLSPAATALIDAGLAIFGVLTVETAVITWLVTGTAGTLVLVVSVGRHFGFGRPDLALGRTALAFGLKAYLSRIMALGNYRADQWLVGVLAGPYELGLYSIAVTLSEALFYIPGVIVLIQRPDLVRALPRDAAELAATVFRRAVLLSMAAGLALLAAAPLLCVGLFGEEFRDSTDQLRVLALGCVAILTKDLLTNAVIAQRRPLAASIADAAALVMTIVFALILVPSLGGLGAAIGRTAAYTTGAVVMVVIYRRVLGGHVRALVPHVDDARWYLRKVQAARAAWR